MQSRIRINLFFQFLESAFLILLSFVTFPYITRVLGPEKIGQINFVDFTAQIFLLMAAFGIPVYAIREVAKLRTDKAALQALTSQLLTLHFITSVISTVLFLLVLYATTDWTVYKPLVVLAALHLFFNAWALDWLIKGLEAFRFFTLRLLITRFILVIVVFLLIRAEDDYIFYYALFVGASIAVLIIDLFFAYKNGAHIGYSSGFRKHLKPLSFFFLTSVSMSIYTFMDTYLLGLISGSLAVGFYTTAFKMVALPQRFVQDISAILLPRISSLAVEKNMSEMARLLGKALLFVFTIAAPLGFLFLVTAPEIILLIGSSTFLPAAVPLQILSFLPLVAGMSTALANQVLVPLGKEKELLKAVAAGSIISILLCLLLCPVWQHNGAAVACLIAELVVMVLVFRSSRRSVSIKISAAQVSGILLSSLLFLPLAILLRTITSASIIIFCVTALVGTAGYFLLQLLLFRNPIVQELFSSTERFFKRKG